ncbi:MAG: anti-sigma-I factor RsgI family protein [Thermincolia bacterium]
MGLNKGLVTKIKENYCIVVTKDGEFKRVPLPRQPVRVGKEITFREGGILNNLTKYSLLVASFLLVALGVNLFYQPGVTPAAYVSLDINPSLELAVDEQQKVIDIIAFNQEGQQLANLAEVKNTDLYQAVEKIMVVAITNKYVQPTKENIILTAVFPTDGKKLTIDEDRIQKVISTNLSQSRLPGEVVVYRVDDNIRKKATELKLTMGKTVILEYAKNSGNQITATEIKSTSITNLVNKGKIKTPLEYSKEKVGIPVKSSILKVNRDKDDDVDSDDREENDQKSINKEKDKKKNKAPLPVEKQTKNSNDDEDKRDDDDKRENKKPANKPNPNNDKDVDNHNQKDIKNEDVEEDESRPLPNHKDEKQKDNSENNKGDKEERGKDKGERDEDRDREKQKESVNQDQKENED